MTAKIIGEEYKGYKLVSGFGSMVEIKALGKGTVNLALRGSYTSKDEAMKAIDSFVEADKLKRGKDSGTKQTTQRV